VHDLGLGHARELRAVLGEASYELRRASGCMRADPRSF
jgi:hypothetical protein